MMACSPTVIVSSLYWMWPLPLTARYKKHLAMISQTSHLLSPMSKAPVNINVWLGHLATPELMFNRDPVTGASGSMGLMHKNYRFICPWRPSWRPSWILKNPRGWQAATRAKFHWDTYNYWKKQRNDCYETKQGYGSCIWTRWGSNNKLNRLNLTLFATSLGQMCQWVKICAREWKTNCYGASSTLTKYGQSFLYNLIRTLLYTDVGYGSIVVYSCLRLLHFVKFLSHVPAYIYSWMRTQYWSSNCVRP